MSKIKLKATALCMSAAFVLSLSAPPSALAHNGATGIVKDRMGKFEASEKATKRIKQAFSRGDTAVVIAEAKFLLSWAREIQSYFPENSNQPPSEAKVEICPPIPGFSLFAFATIAIAFHRTIVLIFLSISLSPGYSGC